MTRTRKSGYTRFDDQEEKHFSNELGHSSTFANELHSRARKAGDLILRGGKQDAEKLFMMILDTPGIKTIETEVKDTHGNTIKGTLPAIAAIVSEMSAVTGEFAEVPPLIHDVKHCGFLEMLLSVGTPLSQKEIYKLKKIDISADYLDKKAPNELQTLGIPHSKHDAEYTVKMSIATIRFGEGILNPALNYQDIKTTFNLAFSPRIITSGFAFDIKILYNTAYWFYQNQHRFNDKQTLQFWEDGFNQLLNHMSNRDKQLLQTYAFSDHGILEYQFEAISAEKEIKESDIPNGKIYLSPGGGYILHNVDGEIHKGEIKYLYFFKDNTNFDQIADYENLLIQIGFYRSKKEILKLISQNGHIQLAPKTTAARCLRKEEDFSPKENLLFLFSPFQRAKLAEDPNKLAQLLKTECLTIATNFHSHATNKEINYMYAIHRAEKAASVKNTPTCSVM